MAIAVGSVQERKTQAFCFVSTLGLHPIEPMLFLRAKFWSERVILMLKVV